MSSVTVVGLDLAKVVFQVCCVDAAGKIVLNRSLKRREVLDFFRRLPPCRVGIEACGSSHHWARQLLALDHDVKLMPPAYVKPYVRRQKNDATDAVAIAEAVTRPSMRFVAVRSIDNQALLMQHRVRETLVGQRMQLLNSLRGHMAEAGVIAAQGARNARAMAELLSSGHPDIPACVAKALLPLATQIAELDTAIEAADKQFAAAAKADRDARRLMTIPGVGPQTAHAIVATLGPGGIAQFSGPREFAAFLGLVPRQNSSGGKQRLGRISKMGNAYLRKLLVVGADSVLHHRERHTDALRTWAKALLETKPFKLVAVAIANKVARIVFAMLSAQTDYTAKAAAA
ncbi:IS110 family transposase [Novosphingobium sp.]|uniref:IS110 family transposase n=1 Tax=Novosphingobium sp. TaxID=1874826 RepID=UPI003D137ECE